MILRGDPFAWDLDEGRAAVAIGVFDGVHRGHQAVMHDMTRKASSLGLVPVALTFDPHPLEFLAPERAPLMLTTVEQRAALLEGCGVGILGVLPFLEIRDLDPRAFVAEILVLRLHASVVVVGADFRFGRDRGGDSALLSTLGADHGFEVEVVEMIGDGGPAGVISSTRIRALVALGDVAMAAVLLGRPFALTGPVIHGDARGGSIGFPTANLHIPDRMAVPGDGVYAAWAEIAGTRHRSVVNIGVRPTFGVRKRAVEAHVLGFEDDVYGTAVTLHFVARIREERRFPDVTALVAQIGADRDTADRILAEDECAAT